MKRYLFILLLNLNFLFAGLFAQSEFRTFKDAQDREMEARLTRVSGEDVYIERRDGLATRLDLSLFSKEDQKFIQKWEKKERLKSGVLDVRFTTEESDVKKFTRGGVKQEVYDSSYGIVIKNTSFEDIKKLRIEYLIIKYEDAIAAQKRSEGELKRMTDKIELPLLKSRSKKKVMTESFSMRETQLEPGYTWAGGGKDRSQDRLDGIWIRIYADEVLAFEDSRPKSLMRKEVW